MYMAQIQQSKEHKGKGVNKNVKEKRQTKIERKHEEYKKKKRTTAKQTDRKHTRLLTRSINMTL